MGDGFYRSKDPTNSIQYTVYKLQCKLYYSIQSSLLECLPSGKYWQILSTKSAAAAATAGCDAAGLHYVMRESRFIGFTRSVTHARRQRLASLRPDIGLPSTCQLMSRWRHRHHNVDRWNRQVSLHTASISDAGKCITSPAKIAVAWAAISTQHNSFQPFIRV